MNTSEDAIRDASFFWRCIMLMLVFSGMATQSVSSFAIPLSPSSPFSFFPLPLDPSYPHCTVGFLTLAYQPM